MPFLLGGILQCHLDQHKTDDEYQQTAEIVAEDTYVDDVIGGGDTVAEVRSFKEKTIKILGDAQFELHKWHSNIPEIASNVEEIINEDEITYTKDQLNQCRKESSILGVPWNEQEDTITVNIPKGTFEATKRGVLKFLASIYDPLGIISPILLKGKILFRDICDQKLNWDKPLPDELWRRWINWKQYLPAKLKIPRSIPTVKLKVTKINLHVFADASKSGVDAALYAVVHQENKISQGLLGSNSRLAKKNLTIPRLELVAAHMAANIYENARKALRRFPITQTVAWLDSTVIIIIINV